MIPLNDWEIKKCLRLCLALLLTVFGLIGLAGLGFDIPVLRQVVVFISLTFIPGILLLRILRIHNVGIIESLLYSVGLSLAFVMAVGVVANFALPPLGISHPITLAPLVGIFAIFFLILCFLAYARDKDFHLVALSHKDSGVVAKPSIFANLSPYLLAVLLPLLAILGATLVNSYHNNTLLFAFTFIVIVIIGLVAFNKFIPPRVYPFLIFMMGMALIYQTTLISSNLVGSDIHEEYYSGNLVVGNGYWNATIPGGMNSCLSVVLLAPIYSLLLKMDIVWLFKVIYPLLFCLVPLAIFYILCLQIKPRYAFFATFFLISMPMFTMDMAQLCRQQVSELFFVLVILLMVDRKLTLMQRTILILIFGMGVVVSHYGMGTGYIGYLIFGALVFIFIKSRLGRVIWHWLIGKAHSLPTDLTSPGAFNKRVLVVIVGVSLVFMLGYYSIVASGSAMGGTDVAIYIARGTAEQMIQSITTSPPAEVPSVETSATETPPSLEVLPTVQLPSWVQSITARFPFLNPLTKEPLAQTALGLDFPSASLWGKIWRIFQYLVELCLVVGFIRLIFRPGGLGKFKTEYISLTVVSVFILFGIFIISARSYGMGVSRIFQITLLLMAPLVLFGGEAIGYGIVKLAAVFRRGFSFNSSVLLPCVVLGLLVPYFIFNSGVVFELSRSQTTYFIDTPYSIALSSHRVDLTTTYTKQDVIARDWLSLTDKGDYPICTDYHGMGLFYWQLGLLPRDRVYILNQDAGEMPPISYIYLRTWNTQKEELTIATAYGVRQSFSLTRLPWLVSELDGSSRIYDNGGTQIFLDFDH